jgi:hypothetical protein
LTDPVVYGERAIVRKMREQHDIARNVPDRGACDDESKWHDHEWQYMRASDL